MEPVTLTTGRLVLRPWRFTDLDAVVAYADDPLYSRFLPIPQPYGRSDGEAFISSSILKKWDDDPTFAITLDDVAIGGIDLHLHRGTNEGIASLGYGIGHAHWGKGLTAEAATAVIAWAFTTWPFEKVFATADAENSQSWRVMEKLGMAREGVLRKHRLLRGERRDIVYYGMLRGEWERLRLLS